MLEYPSMRLSLSQDFMPVPTLSSKMNGNSSLSPEQTSLPQALQNLQRLLHSQLANVNPIHLQQALQQRQQQMQMAEMAGRKQLEQMLQQLQEQLQLNILQQTHLGAGPGKPNAAAMQQLQQQQQQLVAQMQMTQQALMLGQSMEGGGGKDSHSMRVRERHMSETYGSTGSSDGSLKENRPDNNNGGGEHLMLLQPAPNFKGELQNGRHAGSSGSTRMSPPSFVPGDNLFSHGHCHWPGCDFSCPDTPSFMRHLSKAHSLDDKATAQTRVQMQIVSQLEMQLNKEKEKLQAMMRHLRLETRNGELKEVASSSSSSRQHSPSPKRFKQEHKSSPERSFSSSSSLLTSSTVPSTMSLQSPLSALTAAVRSPLMVSSPSHAGPIRPKPAASLVERPSTSMGLLPLPPGFDERRGRGDRGNPNLDPGMDLKLNAEFYMNNDVRPPYTYAALIRYAVLETSDQQLTLHEIYNWFTTTFMYFRRNAASWKNAVRHNLSLHKCFMRVENVKGAVWTVDDDEYHKRRPPRGVQSGGGGGSASNSPTLTPQAPSLLDHSLSHMLSAAAAAAAAAGSGNSFADHLPFFNHAALMEQMRRSGGGSSGQPAFPDMKAGMESPPPSLDNRSTPGSLDLSRVKAEDSPPPSLLLLKKQKMEEEYYEDDEDDEEMLAAAAKEEEGDIEDEEEEEEEEVATNQTDNDYSRDQISAAAAASCENEAVKAEDLSTRSALDKQFEAKGAAADNENT